jgi:DNA-binding protein Fis
MTAKTSRTRKDSGRNGTLEVPLRNHAERALSDYFSNLNGHKPAHLYDLVLREVEEPRFPTRRGWSISRVRSPPVMSSC